MMKTRLRAGDKVKILANELEPQYVGKTGEVKKVYCSFDEEAALYRVSVDGTVLRGVAMDKDLEKC